MTGSDGLPIHETGQRVQIRYDDDLGPMAGQMVEVLRGPNLDGLYQVKLVMTSWVSPDDIRA